MKLSPQVQQSLDRVVEKFKTGDLSPITQVIRTQIDPQAPANRWSFCNKVLAYVQAGELDCRGFMQWKTLGRNVRKGSKAVYIIKPITTKRRVAKDGQTSEETVCVGFGSVPVFPASATEGEEALSAYEPVELPPLSDIAKKLGIEVVYVPAAPGRLGDCDVYGNRIRLGSQSPSVFFHELTHAIHAKIEHGLQGGLHEDQETVAELTATILMDFYGISDHSGNAWEYIRHYAKDPLEAITKALSTVEKVLQVIFAPVN